jgi:pyridoxamine 5'-phosphate oxidase
MNALAHIRKEYRMNRLSRDNAEENAMQQFEQWWNDAVKSEIEEVNAMTLATASSDGLPSARIVLLKGISPAGFQFFTNYDSFKGKQLMENPRACLVFFWKELQRQVRITGLVEKLSREKSDDYFNSRPEGSRIGALASPQSEVIESSEWLHQRAKQLSAKYTGHSIPRPAHWGGYLVRPVTIEFWQGRPDRLHDRLLYSLQENGEWSIEILAP